MNVLTVGDGDFTFSLAIARILFPDNTTTSNNNSPNTSILIATSYETRQTLHAVYPNIEHTISELERLGATVCFRVDATDLKRTIPEGVLRVTGGVVRDDDEGYYGASDDGTLSIPAIETKPITKKHKKKKTKKKKKSKKR